MLWKSISSEKLKEKRLKGRIVLSDPIFGKKCILVYDKHCGNIHQNVTSKLNLDDWITDGYNLSFYLYFVDLSK